MFTHTDTAQQKISRKDGLQLYLKFQAAEQALYMQVIKAIHSMYLDTLSYSDTDMINTPPHKIMDHLMKNCSQVALEDVDT